MTASLQNTKRIRTLIVDDEPLARQLLRGMLTEHRDIELIGEADSGTAALSAILSLRPDLVLLDVQMPGMNGFEVLESLPADRLPEVLFVTAYDQYALRAFQVHAIGYLLKPFDEERLAAALDGARRRLLGPAATVDSSSILSLLKDLHQKTSYVERLAIRTGERAILLPVAQIDRIEADGKYLNVICGAQTHTMRETMTRIATRLNPSRFVRVSRSAIVNLDRVREIQPWFRGEYVLVMHDGAQITTTRAYRDQVKQLLEYEP